MVFGRRRQLSEPTPSAADVPSGPTPAELAAERRKQAEELTTECGQLATASEVAFKQALAEARAEGLNVAEQEARIKDLWATGQIPRITVTLLRSFTTRVGVVRQGFVHEVKVDLEDYDVECSSGTTRVDRDFDRFPDVREREDEPIVFLPDIKGYIKGEVNARFMPDATPEVVERLGELRQLLQEASVVAAGPESTL